MKREPIATITAETLTKWLLLGLPAAALWVIGGLGAASLLGGLSNGSVVPGTDSSVQSLTIMWGFIVLCAVLGVAVGMASLVRPISTRLLAFSAVMGFVSLFFSVLT